MINDDDDDGDDDDDDDHDGYDDDAAAAAAADDDYDEKAFKNSEIGTAPRREPAARRHRHRTTSRPEIIDS